MGVCKDLIECFWSKTVQHGMCLIWTGAQKIGRDGTRLYGLFAGGDRLAKREGRRRMVQAHRFIYEQCVESLGIRILMHTCDTPACVSLQHLSPGTQALNIADCVAKGRNHKPPLRAHCAKGHLLDEDNTYVSPDSKRECRICRSEARPTYIRKRNCKPPPKTHCVNGHLFDAANTYVNSAGRRECRVCRKARDAIYRSKHG